MIEVNSRQSCIVTITPSVKRIVLLHSPHVNQFVVNVLSGDGVCIVEMVQSSQKPLTQRDKVIHELFFKIEKSFSRI